MDHINVVFVKGKELQRVPWW